MTISATKPAGNAANGPRWASVSPGTVRVEPSAGAKDTGWTDGQRPAFNVMNWLQGVAYDWQQYLEDATDQLESTKYDRDGSKTITGDILPDANEAYDIGSSSVRFDDGWFDRVIVDQSLLARLSNTADIGQSTFAFATIYGNELDLNDASVLAASAGPTDNTLVQETIPKAWGRVTMSNATPFVVTSSDGINFTAARVDANTVRITFANGMSGASAYVVLAGNQQNGNIQHWIPSNHTTTTFDLTQIDETGAPEDIDGTGGVVGFVVFGRQ